MDTSLYRSAGLVGLHFLGQQLAVDPGTTACGIAVFIKVPFPQGIPHTRSFCHYPFCSHYFYH